MSQRPDDSYLVRLGTLMYLVADIEWLMLGDLQRFETVVPADLTVEVLSAYTTGTLANKLTASAQAVSDPDVAAYLAGGGAALRQIVDRRNAVFHARPASVDGRNRLYRWVKKKVSGVEKVEAFPIDDRWLDDLIAEVEQLLGDLEPLRTAAHLRYPLS